MSSISLRERFQRWLDHLRGGTVDYANRELRSTLERVNVLEPAMERSSDRDLRRRGEELRRQAGSGVSLDSILAEGIALVREAGRRAVGLRLHDVQVLAAVALHRGKIAELATGEGKTLAAVAPAWLGSLTGLGVHLLTFNDYLARRDAAWMGPIYEFLGATVDRIQEGMTDERRRRAYACDVTYATAKQVGFDYLRDQLALEKGVRVHRPFHHAILDEADSLLIDEARVPLVLAGGGAPLLVDPRRLVSVVRSLERDRDYEMDDYARNVFLTERGARRAERELGISNLYDASRRELQTALNLALHAGFLLRRDVDYIVRDGLIEVVDEFTGRVVPDRRWPDGLHPALEAKEGLRVRPEGVVLASIPLQHLFRLYPRLSGMTATAVPAAEELRAFYGLDVAVIPPHRPCIRRDEPDVVFTDRASKHEAIVREVARMRAAGRPVLVGTASIAESERLAAELDAAGIPGHVLNAKNDEEEARIIAEAGRKGAVTISTNMAGRGTDIRLGGSSGKERDEVAASGGLHVIGTNKHESRRIDDQLLGRAGRQGDPGSSCFFVSLEDDLVERYGIAEAISPLLEGRATGRVEVPGVVAEVERAQRIVEGQNFEIRQTLWKYSAMVEEQRRILATLRERAFTDPAALELFARRCPERHGLILDRFGVEMAASVERRVLLVEIDRAWSGHLARLADVRENIHIHSLANLDWFGGIWGMRKTPLDVFHEMAIQAFDETCSRLEEQAVATFESLEITGEGVDMERDDLKGPQSTWTYLVSDTPFESTIIRIYRGLMGEGTRSRGGA